MKPDEQNWQDFNRQPVKEIWWTDTETEKGRHIFSDDAKKLQLHVEYMGDRTELWVSVMTPDGREAARHNLRMLETIVWF